MAQFDRKSRGFYDSLTDQERKKFSNYLMLRWGSAVQGSRELQEFYVIATNERFNKHFFTVGKHPKLQWLMATSVSPNLGPQRHQWIAAKKKDPTNNDIKKFLMERYPTMKLSDIQALSSLVTKQDIKEYQTAHGNNED